MPVRAVAELLLLSVLWGSAYLFTRAAVPAFGPLPMVGVRFAIACALLLPLVWLYGRQAQLLTYRWHFLLLGIVFTALPFVLIAFAAQTLGAGMLAILNATAPLFGALIARLWLGEAITLTRAVGLALGFTGVGVLVWGQATLVPGALLAVGLMLGSSVAWGFAANYARVKMAQVDPIVITAANALVAALIVLPVALPAWPAEPPGTRAWLELLSLGAFSSAAGTLMYFRLLRTIGTVPTMSVTFLSPVVALVSGALYLGEPITWRTLVGGAIVLLGTAMVLGLFKRR